MRQSLSVITLLCIAPTVLAQSNISLDTLQVEHHEQVRQAIPDTQPKAEISKEDIQKINANSAEDTLRQRGDITLRKRHIGDQNSPIAMRDTNLMQTPRTVVMGGGLPLSSFLGAGWDNSPNWSLIAPEEISHVEVLYGPYQARYSGNSMGGAVIMHTDLPDQKEARIKGQWFEQHYSAYGESYHLPGYKGSLLLGDAKGPWHYRLLVEHLNSEAQPMSYGSANCFGCSGGADVTGAIPFDGDYMVNAQSVSKNQNNLYKFALGYDLTPDLVLKGQVGFMDYQQRQMHPRTFLRDSSGDPIYSGDVNINGEPYNFSGKKLERGKQQKLLTGLTLEGRIADNWRTDSRVSFYQVLDAENKSSATDYQQPNDVMPGSLASDKGSGWQDLDVVFVREHNHALAGNELLLGYHVDHHRYKNKHHATDDWRHPTIQNVDGDIYGSTMTQAIFAQNDWFLDPQWQVTLGARQEWWQAQHGRLQEDDATTHYPHQRHRGFSPKVGLDYFFGEDDDWQVSLQLARAVRFPTAGEMYQGGYTYSGDFVNSSSPTLKPEKGIHANLGILHHLTAGQVRFDVWQNHIHDSIFAETDSSTGIITYSNIDKVVSQGATLQGKWRASANSPFAIQANLSYTRPIIRRHQNLDDARGSDLPRVPRWRGGASASMDFAQYFTWSAGMRYSNAPYNTLDNSDSRRTEFGVTSKFLVWDSKLNVNYKQWQAAIGVNNLTNEKYYAYHPYPGRTYFAELQWNY